MKKVMLELLKQELMGVMVQEMSVEHSVAASMAITGACMDVLGVLVRKWSEETCESVWLARFVLRAKCVAVGLSVGSKLTNYCKANNNWSVIEDLFLDEINQWMKDL